MSNRAKPIETVLAKHAALDAYSLILLSAPVSATVLKTISQHGQSRSVPVIYFHSVGFYSHFSLQLPPAYPIVDTHPDPDAAVDLRVLCPWPELAEYAKTKTAGLADFDEDDHNHIPYLLLLLHYLDEWKSGHGGSYPQEYREKNQFKDFLRQHMRTSNAELGEENFEEALAAVLRTVNPPSLSSSVRAIFTADESRNLTKEVRGHS